MRKYCSLLALALPTIMPAAQIDVIDTITVTPTEITNYQDVVVKMTWSVKAPTVAAKGDTFSVAVPPQIKLFDSNATMLDSINAAIGDCVVVANNFTCTFKRDTVTDGTIEFTKEFADQSVTEPKANVPIEFKENGKKITKINMTVSPVLIDPNEKLFKSGSQIKELKIGEKLDWFVRVNCENVAYTNFNFSDEISDGHKIDLRSVYLEKGDSCDSIGRIASPTVLINNGVDQSGASDRITITDKKIELMTNSSNQAYILTYKTEITKELDKWGNTAYVFSNNKPVKDSYVFLEKSQKQAIKVIGHHPDEPNNAPNNYPGKIPSLSWLGMLTLLGMVSLGGFFARRKMS